MDFPRWLEGPLGHSAGLFNPCQSTSVLHSSLGVSRDAFCCPLQVLRPLRLVGNAERVGFPEPALKDPCLSLPLQAVQAWLCVLAKQTPGISLRSNAKQYKTV